MEKKREATTKGIEPVFRDTLHCLHSFGTPHPEELGASAMAGEPGDRTTAACADHVGADHVGADQHSAARAASAALDNAADAAST